MLLNLHIENVAIINKSDIEFTDGFNVLTGETGAGKSIIIDSINLLLGNKGSRDMISTGKDFAFVSAVFCNFNDFQTQLLLLNDIIPDEDCNVIVSRKITKDGRSISKINGQNVNVSTLKAVAPILVNIFGQHDGSKILDPSTHIEYLDNYCKNNDLIDEYKTIYQKVKEARNKIQYLTDIKDSKEQLEYTLKFQIDELEKAKLQAGEYDKLKLARASAQHSALVSESLFNSQSILSNDNGGLLNDVSHLVTELEKLRGILNGADEQLKDLMGVIAVLQETSAYVSDKISDIDENTYSVEYIEERLYIIEKMISKYASEQGAIDKLAELKEQLDKINDNDNELLSAVDEYNNYLKKLNDAAEKISQSRKNGAASLCEQISLQLCELDMPNVVFCIDVNKKTNSRGGTKYTSIGFDDVEFLVSANAGQQPKPISKIASGGELSRIMLCLKSSLTANSFDCDTYIYDEVDSGVSGATAQKIGRKLKKSASDKQVFCITHLAQIAAMADAHYKVEKYTKDGLTQSSISILNYDERAKEIARIMGGVEITEQLYKSAKELIDNSSK